jgi:hypothetical protein
MNQSDPRRPAPRAWSIPDESIGAVARLRVSRPCRSRARPSWTRWSRPPRPGAARRGDLPDPALHRHAARVRRHAAWPASRRDLRLADQFSVSPQRLAPPMLSRQRRLCSAASSASDTGSSPTYWPSRALSRNVSSAEACAAGLGGRGRWPSCVGRSGGADGAPESIHSGAPAGGSSLRLGLRVRITWAPDAGSMTPSDVTHRMPIGTWSRWRAAWAACSSRPRRFWRLIEHPAIVRSPGCSASSHKCSSEPWMPATSALTAPRPHPAAWDIPPATDCRPDGAHPGDRGPHFAALSALMRSSSSVSDQIRCATWTAEIMAALRLPAVTGASGLLARAKA